MKRKYLALPAFVLANAVSVCAQTDNGNIDNRKPLFDFEYAKPVFKLENEQLKNSNKSLRFGVVTGYREGVKPLAGPFGVNFMRYDDPATGTARIAMYNLSIAEMFYHFPVNHHMVVLKVKDPTKYIYKPEYGDKEAWLRKNGKCFELTMPINLMGGIEGGTRFIEENIEELLGIKYTLETRKIKVLVLTRTSTVDKIRSAATNTGQNGSISENGSIRTALIQNIGDKLYNAGHPIMINETNYENAIDMELNLSSWNDLNEIRTALKRYDLDLKEEMREVKDVLVIKEIK